MNIGLIKGRHEISEVENYVFDEAIEDVTNLAAMYSTAYAKLINSRDEKINLYVTGLTVACATVIKVCQDNDIELSLWHYNTATGTYFEQPMVVVDRCSFCGNPRGNGWYCKHCGAN